MKYLRAVARFLGWVFFLTGLAAAYPVAWVRFVWELSDVVLDDLQRFYAAQERRKED